MNHFAEVNTDADKNVKANAQLSESVMNDMGKPVKGGSADGSIKSQLDQANNSMQRDGILPGLSIEGSSVVSPDKFGGKAGIKPDALDHQYTNQEIKQMIIDKLKGGKAHAGDSESSHSENSDNYDGGKFGGKGKKVILDGGLKDPVKSEQGENSGYYRNERLENPNYIVKVPDGKKPEALDPAQSADKPVVKKPTYLPDPMLVY
jgi:hypothetical protein